MNELYRTSATAVGGRDGHVRSADGIIDLDLRVPASMGGKGGATTPEDLFASGWSACFNGALNLAIKLAHIRPTGDVSVKATVALGKTDAGDFQLAGEIEATIPGVDQPTAQKLVEQAHTICPYSRATRGNIEVKLTAKVTE